MLNASSRRGKMHCATPHSIMHAPLKARKSFDTVMPFRSFRFVRSRCALLLSVGITEHTKLEQVKRYAKDREKKQLNMLFSLCVHHHHTFTSHHHRVHVKHKHVRVETPPNGWRYVKLRQLINYIYIYTHTNGRRLLSGSVGQNVLLFFANCA